MIPPCEAEGLLYAFGYATNDVLEARTDPLLADLDSVEPGRLEFACARCV